jgi:hypothetical protein
MKPSRLGARYGARCGIERHDQTGRMLQLHHHGRWHCYWTSSWRLCWAISLLMASHMDRIKGKQTRVATSSEAVTGVSDMAMSYRRLGKIM